MKKAVALLLSIILCLSFCSCGSESNTPSSSNAQNNVSVSNNSQNNVPTSNNDFGIIQNEQEAVAHSPSTVCPACSGTKICTKCYGDSDCLECDGSGTSRCWDCLGDGECLNCSGDGGSYEYNFYSGDSEWEKCSFCHGSGNCGNCRGKGEATCSRCYGSGSSCSYCFNTGICSTCQGIGEITQTAPSNNSNQQQPSSNQAQSNNQESQDNTTGSQKTSNYLIATIDGEEYQFDLFTARVKTDISDGFTYIQAHYQATNPRGELLYDLHLAFDANLGCGTYDIIGDGYGLDLGISLSPANSDISYHTTRSGGSSAVGSFTIEERSADWRTYSGYANATLKPSNSPVTIDVDISLFDFTLT